MRRTLGTMMLAAAVLVGCAGASGAPAPAGTESTVPGDPGDKGTVPADPASYAAQEWATFQMIDMPDRYYEMEMDYHYASYAAIRDAVSTRTIDAFRSEATPVLNSLDDYLASLQPAIDVLDKAADAGARDNDLADLAPALMLFHRAYTNRALLLREHYEAILSGDPERMGATEDDLYSGPIPKSYMCAYLALAASPKWTARFTPAMNQSITKVTGLYECDGPVEQTENTSA